MSEQFSSSAFDPSVFLDASTTEANEKRQLLPIENPDHPSGTYVGVIKGIKIQHGIIEKGDRAGQPWVSVLVPIQIEVPQSLQDSLKLPKVLTLTDSAFLDLTPQKTVDNAPGRNRRQRQYRDALRMNSPGDTWSWRKAEGQALRVKIQHEIYEGEAHDRIGNLFPL